MSPDSVDLHPANSEVQLVFCELNPLERAVLDLQFGGSDSRDMAIRKQIQHCVVCQREWTNVGFYSLFRLLDDSLVLPQLGSFNVGDIIGNIAGLKNGVGFECFVKDGVISCIEGFSYEELWPNENRNFRLANSLSGQEIDGQTGIFVTFSSSQE